MTAGPAPVLEAAMLGRSTAKGERVPHRRVYTGGGRRFDASCLEVGSAPLPAVPARFTVYLAVHADA
jgi:hypothetical protein